MRRLGSLRKSPRSDRQAGQRLLRDWFAGQCLNGLIALESDAEPSGIAHDAYLYADAMLAERYMSHDPDYLQQFAWFGETDHDDNRDEYTGAERQAYIKGRQLRIEATKRREAKEVLSTINKGE